MANELAVVFYDPSTVFNIMPVIAGRIAPPKKRRSHKRTAIIIKLSKNGIGAAHPRHKIAHMHVILAAYSEL